MDKIPYPIRINRYLAMKGFGTRRSADELIKSGKVMLNGKPAKLGDQVNAGDKVDVDVKAVEKERSGFVYVAYFKPRDIVTVNPEQGQQEIADVFQFEPKVAPVGRLDRDTEGLIILTNDGRLTDRMLNPKFDHEKEYEVTVDKNIPPRDLRRLEKGVQLEDDEMTKRAKTDQLDSKSFRIIITEGKKHQIRRMLAAIGYVVRHLKRVRVMNIRVGRMKPGEHRVLEGAELSELLKSLDLAGPVSSRPAMARRIEPPPQRPLGRSQQGHPSFHPQGNRPSHEAGGPRNGGRSRPPFRTQGGPPRPNWAPRPSSGNSRGPGHRVPGPSSGPRSFRPGGRPPSGTRRSGPPSRGRR